MSVEFYLFTLEICALFVFSGIGLTLLICPKDLLKYSIFFSPYIGLGYLSFICWIFVNNTNWGTDVYGYFLLFPPAVFLIISSYVKRNYLSDILWPLQRKNIPLILFCIVIFIVISSPYVLTTTELTAITIGNSDIGNYATISAFVTKGTLINNPFGDDQWISGLTPSVFSAYISTAIPSSILNIESYKIVNLVSYLYYIFILPLVFIISRDIFKFNQNLALVATVLTGINTNLLLIIFQVFLSQIIGMGFFLCIVFLILYFIQHQDNLKVLVLYIPLSVFLLFGLLISYPTYLPLLFIPLSIFIILEITLFKRMKNMWSLICFFLITAFFTFCLSPLLISIRIKELISYTDVVVGFNPTPMLPSWILGVIPFTNPINLIWMNLNIFSPIDIILSFFIIILALFSLIYIYNQDKTLFHITAIFGFFIFSIYGYLIVKEFESPGFTGEGYKAFKLLTYFIPLMVISILAYFKKMDMEIISKNKKNLQLSILILLIIFNIFSAFQMINANYQYNIPIRSDIVDLNKMGIMDKVSSLNINEPDILDHMWMYYFTFLHTKTYSSYHQSPLLGEWTLKRGTINISNNSQANDLSNHSIIRVNTNYYLLKNQTSTD